MSNELPIKLFCFEAENIYEACVELFGFGNGRIVGTDTIYNSIWIKLFELGDPIVEFYETENDFKSESPTMEKTLSECYSIYQNPNNENK